MNFIHKTSVNVGKSRSHVEWDPVDRVSNGDFPEVWERFNSYPFKLLHWCTYLLLCLCSRAIFCYDQWLIGSIIKGKGDFEANFQDKQHSNQQVLV